MNGLLLLDKPSGITSHGVVKKLRKILGMRKVGHAGTLDPLATGLLLVLVGKATKLSPFLQPLDKVYRGKMVFGITTDTMDSEGKILEEKDASFLTREEVERVFSLFRGRITQDTPMVSAAHWRGKRLYKLAREGKKVKTPPREVEIHRLSLLNFSPSPHPEAEFEVHTSKGTYIRALCHDIGKVLECGAHQSSLRRLRVGTFRVEDAHSLEEVEKVAKEGRSSSLLLPLSECLPHFLEVRLKKGMENLVRWGRPLYLSHISSFPSSLKKGDRVTLLSEKDELLAIAVSLQDFSYLSSQKEAFKYLRVLIP